MPGPWAGSARLKPILPIKHKRPGGKQLARVAPARPASIMRPPAAAGSQTGREAGLPGPAALSCTPTCPSPEVSGFSHPADARWAHISVPAFSQASRGSCLGKVRRPLPRKPRSLARGGTRGFKFSGAYTWCPSCLNPRSSPPKAANVSREQGPGWVTPGGSLELDLQRGPWAHPGGIQVRPGSRADTLPLPPCPGRCLAPWQVSDLRGAVWDWGHKDRTRPRLVQHSPRAPGAGRGLPQHGGGDPELRLHTQERRGGTLRLRSGQDLPLSPASRRGSGEARTGRSSLHDKPRGRHASRAQSTGAGLCPRPHTRLSTGPGEQAPTSQAVRDPRAAPASMAPGLWYDSRTPVSGLGRLR